MAKDPIIETFLERSDSRFDYESEKKSFWFCDMVDQIELHVVDIEASSVPNRIAPRIIKAKPYNMEMAHHHCSNALTP